MYYLPMINVVPVRSAGAQTAETPWEVRKLFVLCTKDPVPFGTDISHGGLIPAQPLLQQLCEAPPICTAEIDAQNMLRLFSDLHVSSEMLWEARQRVLVNQIVCIGDQYEVKSVTEVSYVQGGAATAFMVWGRILHSGRKLHVWFNRTNNTWTVPLVAQVSDSTYHVTHNLEESRRFQLVNAPDVEVADDPTAE